MNKCLHCSHSLLGVISRLANGPNVKDQDHFINCPKCDEKLKVQIPQFWLSKYSIPYIVFSSAIAPFLLFKIVEGSLTYRLMHWILAAFLLVFIYWIIGLLKVRIKKN